MKNEPLTPAAVAGVLVVDDELGVLKIVQAALTHHGLTAFVAADGPTALSVYERHRKDIGVALLDVRMPRMDGPETLDALRAMNPNLRAVFMSGETGPHTVADLTRRGVAGLFSKPFRSLADLARFLKQTVETSYSRGNESVWRGGAGAGSESVTARGR